MSVFVSPSECRFATTGVVLQTSLVGGCVVIFSIVAGAALIEPKILLGAFVGGVFMAALRWPAATVSLLLIVCQEQIAAQADLAAETFSAGHEFYFMSVARMPLVFWVLAIAACGSAVRIRAQGVRLSTTAQVFLCLAFALSGWAMLFSVAHGGSLQFAVGNTALPFLLTILSFVVFITVDRQPGGRQLMTKVAGIALAIAVLQGVVTIILRQGQSVVVQGGLEASTYLRYLLYYDTSLPAVAGAVALSVLLFHREKALALGLSAWVVFFSYRRSVWAAVVMILLAAVLFQPQRLKALRPFIAPAIVALIALAVVFPSIAGSASSRVAKGYLTIVNDADISTTDVSTVGHITDIENGWSYALRRPLTGWGPDRKQLPGLGANTSASSRLYVHNEFLLDWLRFGVVGMLLVLTLIASMVKMGVETLRQDVGKFFDRKVAAFFSMIVPICVLTAPFLTATYRWPVFIGAAAGLMAVPGVSTDSDGTRDPGVQSR